MRKQNKIKVLLVEIRNKNFGDTVILKNVEYILNTILKKNNKADEVELFHYDFNICDEEQIKYVDAAIFVGGGIVKFLYEEFDYKIIKLLEKAKEYQVPCFFNAVGVEGYAEDNERCQQLKEALNYECVKGISIRDDYSLYCEKYLTNKNIRVSSVFDSAVFTGDAFRCKKKSDSKVVGLGIARAGLFMDNGYPDINDDFLLRFWRDVILELEKSGMSWKLFTNGMDSDERFANRILKMMGRGEKFTQPIDAETVVERIASFSGIIACRMHSNVIAYALGIPSVGLVWNEKLAMWGEKCGYPERFVRVENMTGKYVVDQLKLALNSGCNGADSEEKNGVYNELKWFVENYFVHRKKRIENYIYKDCMMAANLGSKDYIYSRMNTICTVYDSILAGYNLFHVDIRKTTDNQWACISGWDKEVYSKFGINGANDCGILSMKELKSKKYYDFFETNSFDELIKKMSEETANVSRIYVSKGETILSIEDIVGINDICKQYDFSEEKIVLSVNGRDEYDLVKEYSKMMPVLYLAAEKVHMYKQYLQECNSDLVWIEYFDNNDFYKCIREMSEKNIGVIVTTVIQGGAIIKCLEAGASVVGSSIYDVSYMERLTE